MARGAALEVVLTELIEHTEAAIAGLLGSALILDKPTNTLRHSAAVDGLRIGQDKSSYERAVYTGRRVVTADILSDPAWEGYREPAIRAGLRAYWSEPIVSSTKQVLDTFVMYYQESREPEESELQFIESAGRQCMRFRLRESPHSDDAVSTVVVINERVRPQERSEL